MPKPSPRSKPTASDLLRDGRQVFAAARRAVRQAISTTPPVARRRPARPVRRP